MCPLLQPHTRPPTPSTSLPLATTHLRSLTHEGHSNGVIQSGAWGMALPWAHLRCVCAAEVRTGRYSVPLGSAPTQVYHCLSVQLSQDFWVGSRGAVTDQSITDTGAQGSVSVGALLSLGWVPRRGIAGPWCGGCRFCSFNNCHLLPRGCAPDSPPSAA